MASLHRRSHAVSSSIVIQAALPWAIRASAPRRDPARNPCLAVEAQQRELERFREEVVRQAEVIDYRQERITVREFLAQKFRS